MIKDASKIMQLIVEFCRNNLDILMIGGVAVIALILLVSGIKYFKDNDEEDDDIELDELELLEIVEQVKQLQNEDEVEVVLPPLTARVMAEDEPAEEPAEITEEEPEEEPVEIIEEEPEVTPKETIEVEPEEPQQLQPQLEPVTGLAEQPQVETEVEAKAQKSSSTIENLVEEIANLSGTGVKEVEIKVPGAKVKITYSHDGNNSESEESEINKEHKAENPDKQGGDESPKPTVESASAPDAIGGSGVIKFGPDNMNVSRSGRIYSEEELQQQIRD